MCIERRGVCSVLFVVIFSSLSNAVNVHANGLVCDRATLSASSANKWNVFCDSLTSTKLTFDPSQVRNFYVDQINSVVLQAQKPNQVYLSSAFHRVQDLVSTKLTSFSLAAAPEWVHKKQVEISPTAFAKLSALEVLQLHDIPIAGNELHLVLPPSVRKMYAAPAEYTRFGNAFSLLTTASLPSYLYHRSIVGCGLEQISIEMADGSPLSSSAIIEINLHTNALTEIPSFFYSLPNGVTNLDTRLNKFSRIAVPASKEATLEKWMAEGSLQIDNIALGDSGCADGTVKQFQGLSQKFSICVTFDSSSESAKNEDFVLPGNSSLTSTAGDSGSSDSASGSDDDDSSSTSGSSSPTPSSSAFKGSETPTKSTLSPSTTRRPVSSSSQQSGSDESATAAASTDKKNGDDASFPIVIAISLSCGTLITLTIGYFFFHRRRLNESAAASRIVSDGMEKPLRPLGSFWTSLGTEEFSSFMGRRNSYSAATECSMTTPPPELRPSEESRFGGDGSALSSFSTPATPIGGESCSSYDTVKFGASNGYSNMGSPSENVPALAQGFIMSKSLQSLTGVANFSFDEPSGKVGVEDRLAARKKLRKVVETILKDDGGSISSNVTVNDETYECFGSLEETQYSFICKCRPVSDASKKLWLKVFVEHDAIYAAKEYRVLQLLQREPKCSAFVPQLVDVQTHKRLHKLKCSVLVMEMGTSTTFLHAVRGQMEKSSQFQVVHQLSRVVHAIECLHSRHFIHGSLNMEAIVVFDNNKLKFRDLEHATLFKGDVHGYTQASVEFLPPEMARNVLCDGFFDGSEGSISAEPIVASYAFDIWSLGVMILKMYASGKHLDKFSGCSHPSDMLLRLAQPTFHFERSIGLYVPHDDIKDLVRQCLQREPSFRPRIDAILRHPVFQAYEHELSLQSARPTVVSQRRSEGNSKTARETKALSEDAPPSLWLFLPPTEIGLDRCLSIGDWVVQVKQLLQQRKPGDPELSFPLLFMCESSSGLDRPCESTGAYKSRVSVPLSLLSLVVPLVQETTLFLEAKAALSELHIAEVSGLGKRQWAELMNFYRALEKMLLAPMSSFTQMMLTPLQELLNGGDRANAQQVLTEAKCLVFSEEKREHVASLLAIVATDGSGDAKKLRPGGSSNSSQEWAALCKCHMDSEASSSSDSTRWLCRDHMP